MEYNYLILFDYSTGEVLVIHLSAEEQKESDNYDNFEDYISVVLESKYKFKLSNCNWMVTEILSVKHLTTKKED